MTRENSRTIAALVVVLAACAPNENPVTSITDEDRDVRAQRAYTKAQSFFAGSSAELPMGAYMLDPVGDVSSHASVRAQALGLRAAGMRQTATEIVVTEGTRVLRINTQSGAERFYDSALFHRSHGVAMLPYDDKQYVKRAQDYVRSTMPELANQQLHTYKLRRYLNDSAGPDGQRSGETIYQVAVAFNEEIEGLPVIGSGGKVQVHMTPAGEIVAHEMTVRRHSKQVTTIGKAELVAPDAARAEVERRLMKRGVNLSLFTLTRAELGYMRQGRNSLQSVLLPHYAYFYEPRSREVMAKKLVETIPAVKSPALLALLEQDEQFETQRRAMRRAQASADQIK